MKLNTLLQAGALSVFMLSGAAQAAESSHGHNNDAMAGQHTSHESMSGNAAKQKMFLKKKDINGYTVSFHVMKATEGMMHGGSHNLMIKVEKQGVRVKNLKMNSKVIYPDGTDESKPLMTMGEWQMAGYDLKEAGKHQLMVLFKTADGKKHFGGLYYGQ